MGSPVVPALAKIFMGGFEINGSEIALTVDGMLMTYLYCFPILIMQKRHLKKE